MANHPTQRYQTGFGNEFSTEAMEFALPLKGSTPQKPLHGLYAEQIGAGGRRSWLYRIRPSVMHDPFVLYTHRTLIGPPFNEMPTAPNPLRWDPAPVPKKPVDVFDSLFTVAGTGAPTQGCGFALHVYAATAVRRNRYFFNADGEMLFIPEQGAVSFRTEMGVLDVAPGEIAVMPRGVRFSLSLPDTTARGYVCENFGAPFSLPEKGDIDTDGPAYARHFLVPVAAYEDKSGDFELIAKADSALWQAKIGHAPLDVVAWQGNYAPYKYSLDNVMPLGAMGFDQPDSSLFTLLSSPGNVGFSVFPPRWTVAENTFRAPCFRRGGKSVFTGLIRGPFDGKADGGLSPGGYALHNRMVADGPDPAMWERATAERQTPAQIRDTLAFTFETGALLRPTVQAMNQGLQPAYPLTWQDLPKNFKSV